MTTQVNCSSSTIPATMRSAVLSGIDHIDIIEKPTPQPAPGQALVRIRAIGICGSDVHYYVDGHIGDAVATFPFVLGHEPAGEIAQLGEGVTGLKIGDRVAIEPALSCGHCETCLSGHPNCCPSVQFLGSPPIPGIFEEYRVLAAHQCIPIPDSVTFEAAAALEPMAIGVHAVNLSRMRPGDRVAVMGCGPVGILTAMAARAAGASFVAMTDPIPARREHAKRLVADVVINPTDGRAVEAIKAFAGVIDATFEAAGVQEAVDDATKLVRPCGVAVIIGIPAVDRISLDADPLRRKELTLVMARRSNFTLEPSIRLMASGAVNPEAIVTHRFPLERLAEGMEMVRAYRDGVLKAMIVID